MRLCLVALLSPLSLNLLGAETLRVATWNVQNYNQEGRRLAGSYRPDYPKPETEKAALRDTLKAVAPDIVFLQEVGTDEYLHELQRDLKAEGTHYPSGDVLTGPDEARGVAVLSRRPWTSLVKHRRVEFKRRDDSGNEVVELVRRGLLEVEWQTESGPLVVFGVHLKSTLVDRVDPMTPDDRRAMEAQAVRELARKRMEARPGVPWMLVGDCNDTPESRTLRLLTKRGERDLLLPVPVLDSRGERWTLFHANSESYKRVDYLLVSPELLAKVRQGRGVIHDDPKHAAASDHRLSWLDLSLSR